MAKRIFIDANIIVDLSNSDGKLNRSSNILFTKLVNQKEILLCSPVSFAITYYFLSKQIKNNTLLNNKAKRLFAPFTFTKEDSSIMQNVMQSSFTDLEDALQYYSALDAKADVIITKNYFDFSESSIPVYHPLQYINQFLL